MKKALITLLSLFILLTVPVFSLAGAGNFSVSINPSHATLRARIEMNFSFETPIPEESEIFITFPEEMNIPSKISQGLVTINDIPSAEITVDTDSSTVSFALPEGVEDRDYLNIVFPPSCGIANPVSGGNYSIQVDIDESTMSASFTVDSLLEESPIVSISPDLVGKPVSVTIQIPACENLEITKGDTLRITFPVEFTLPEFPEIEYLNINGTAIPVVSIDSNILSVVLGENLDTEKPVTISIEPEFGIIAPNWPDTFKITVEILGKLEETETEIFQILPLKPTTNLSFSPAKTENGWFPEPPTITLTGINNRELYHFLNNQTKTLYTEPFKIEEEGISVLSFMGRIKNGGWEAVKKVTIKLDTQPPIIPELGNSAFTNQEVYELEYFVSDGSPCVSGVVEASETKTLGNNQFQVTLTLKPGKNEFVFFATDSCNREVEVTHTITLDITPPALEIFIPDRADVICGKLIKVEGITEPGATIKVGGHTATVDESGRFWAVFPQPEEEGPINIDVVATDPAGNETKITIPIIYISGTSIQMKLGTTTAKFAGIYRELSVAPYKDFETTFVPLEEIAEVLNFTLSRDEESESKWVLTDEREDRKIFFGTGETKLFIHRQGSVFEIDLTDAPELKDEFLCVSLEFISKVFSLSPSEYADGSITIRFCPR